MTSVDVVGRTARVLPAGDTGLVLEFGNEIDPQVNALVHAVNGALAREKLVGVKETVPSYRSLLIVFDPLVISPESLTEHIVGLEFSADSASTGAVHCIPVRYGDEHGEDLAMVAEASGLSSDEVVYLHAAQIYRVYMIGFAPGFAYLGELDPKLHLPRRVEPRLHTPAGSIMIGGQQTGVAALAMPSGWHLLGRTPLRTFDTRLQRPFRLTPGDTVQFRSIDQNEFRELACRVEKEPYWSCGPA